MGAASYKVILGELGSNSFQMFIFYILIISWFGPSRS